MHGRIRVKSGKTDLTENRNFAIFCVLPVREEENLVPEITVVFFKDDRGNVPVFEWLQKLWRTDRRGFAKCVARVQRLAELGHELRRPEADYLRDGIYELRARRGTVNYRILYFFHGQTLVVLASALTKEKEVPNAEIGRALRRKHSFEEDPDGHTFEQEI